MGDIMDGISTVTYRTGCAARRDLIYISGIVDNIAEEHEDDAWYSRMCTFSPDKERWGYDDLNGWEVVSVCYIPERSPQSRNLCALSKNGDVRLFGPKGEVIEHIPTAGLGEGDELGHGYVSRIREIGPHLYVCGTNGQIYKRISSGWIHIDEPFLGKDAPLTGDEDADAEAIIDSIDTELVFEDINGTDEQDIYVCGMNGLLVHWDGSEWRTLKKLTDAHFNEIHVASPDEVWICGTKGLVLKGNARDGFQKIIADPDGKQFTSIHTFKGKVYLADYEKLYTLEPNEETGRLEARPIIPMFGLTSNLQDAHMLDSADGMLWSFGTKDLAFTEDGQRWTRVEHPDNPKIG